MFEDKLSLAKDGALEQLRTKGAHLGANGIIGIDFDINITNNNMFVVSTNGTAVYLNKQ